MNYGEQITVSLPCPLTDEEFVTAANELAKIDGDIDIAEADEKARASEARSDIAALKSRKRRLRRMVATREEVREVKCTWQGDWEKAAMILRRDDTGELIEVRAMTPEERQAELGFNGHGDRV